MSQLSRLEGQDAKSLREKSRLTHGIIAGPVPLSEYGRVGLPGKERGGWWWFPVSFWRLVGVEIIVTCGWFLSAFSCGHESHVARGSDPAFAESQLLAADEE